MFNKINLSGLYNTKRPLNPGAEQQDYDNKQAVPIYTEVTRNKVMS